MVTISTTDPGAGQAGTALSRTEPNRPLNVAAHSGLLSIAAAVVGVLSYGCTLLMTYLLSPGDYTQFAAAQMLLGIVGIVASALVPLPLSKVVALHAAGSDARREGMSFGVMVSLLAGIAAGAVAGMVTLAFASTAIAMAVAVSALVIFAVAAPLGWLQGELRFVHYAATSVGEVVARLLFSLITVAAFSWGAAGAVWGFLVGALVLMAVPPSFYRDVKWRPAVIRNRARWAETSGIAITLCIVSVLVGADVVIVAILDGGSSSDVAGFQALATIAKAPVYVAAGAALVAFPLLRTPGVPRAEVLSASLRSFSQLAFVAFAVIATAPNDLVALVLPASYHSALDLLPWLALAGLGYSAVTFLATVLLALEERRRCQLGLALASLFIPAGIFIGWNQGAVDGLAVGCAVGAAFGAVAMTAISLPRLPMGMGKAALTGVLLLAALFISLALANFLPFVWLLLVGVVGVGVLMHQNSAVPSVIATLFGTLRAPSGSSPRASRIRLRTSAGEGGRHAQRGRRRPRHAGSSRHGTLLISGVLASLAFAVRSSGLVRANELFIDEVTYADLANQLAQGQIPRSGPDPFFLHPPASFALNALVIRVLGLQGDAMDLALQLRWTNAVLGSLTVVVCFLLVRRMAGTWPAILSALVLATDPFVLRMDGRLMIETPAALAVLIGWLVFYASLHQESRRARLRLEVAAGLVFGLALVTKDMTAAFTIAPVLVAVLWRRTVSWQTALRVSLAAAVPYLVYLLLIVANGLTVDFVGQKHEGLLRIAGAVQETGFNAAPGADLVGRLIEMVGQFGTSYLLLALCPLAGVVAACSPLREGRLMGLLALIAGLFGVYCVVGGAAEEQFGYYVMVAAVLALPGALAWLAIRWPSTTRPSIAVAVAVCVASVVLGVQARGKVDDGLLQARNWMYAELPPGAKMGLTSVTGEFAFLPRENWEVLPSLSSLREAKADYVLTQSYPLSQGYGYAAPELLDWLAEYGQPVFRTSGSSGGDTVVWRLDGADLEAAIAEGNTLPPVTGGYP